MRASALFAGAYAGSEATYGPLARDVHLSIVVSYPEETAMSQEPRFAKPNVDEIPAEIAQLSSVVSELPEEVRETVTPYMEKVIDSTKRRRRILSLVQDALSQLRLDMKYLMFDLEATRRERDDYRRQLEETP